MKDGSLNDPKLDDVNDFKVCDTAMTHLGISNDEKKSIYTLVSAVLHLGNLEFEENLEDAKGMSKNKKKVLKCRHCFEVKGSNDLTSK